MSEEKSNVVNFPDKVAQSIAQRMSQSAQPLTFEYKELQPTMTEEEKRIVQDHLKYFYIGNDLGLRRAGFGGFRPCGSYDFTNPPIKTYDDYIFALEPKLLSNLLDYVCSTKGDGDKMWHCSFMGMNYDVFTVKNPGDEGPEYETFFNSQLMGVTEEETFEEEYSAFYVGAKCKLKRPKAVLVAYEDKHGERCLEELQGDWARYFLQGYELSRGIPFWKTASQLVREKMKKERKKLLGDNWDGIWI